MNRRIAVVTTSRADYSHLYWPLKLLSEHPGVDPVSYTHLDVYKRQLHLPFAGHARHADGTAELLLSLIHIYGDAQ